MGRARSITLRHAEIHENQLIHGLVRGLVAILDELGCFKSISGNVTRQIELQKETLKGNNVERAIVCNENKVIQAIVALVIQLEALVFKVVDIDHRHHSIDFWEDFSLVHL